MSQNRREPIAIDLSDMSGGKNNANPQNAIRNNQLFDCMNVLLEQRGCTRAPGLLGIDTEPALPSYCRMMDFLRKSTGTESLYAISNSILSLVDPADGDLTSKYTLNADVEAYGKNFKNKYFFTCGTDLVKIEENDIAYRVGIAAPTGATAVAVAGGTLAAGAYAVYVSYARKVSGSIVLYSYPQTIGNVTVDGTQGIQVTCANSADPQVGTKVVWLIEPSGTTAYFYYETGNNTTTTFTVNNATAKNILLIMAVEAVANYPIRQFDGITFFDGRMVGWKGLNLYWSIKSSTVSVYDVERFPQENARTFPSNIISCFELNGNLYVNTIGGVYRVSDGDVASKYQKVESYLYFLNQRLHEVYKCVCWGVTNDGVRFFDGTDFSQDLSKDIKPDIDRLVAGIGSNYYPSLKIHRRSGKRTELHISYRDTLLSSTVNNSHLILNLDSIVINSNLEYNTAWESWSSGFNFAVVSSTGVLYMAQNREDSGAQIVKESGWSDRYIYNAIGDFISDVTEKESFVITKAVVPDLKGVISWIQANILSLLNKDASIQLGMLDNDGFNYTTIVNKAGGVPLLFSAPILFPATFPAQNPVAQNIPLPGGKAKGKIVFLKISQTSDDPTFNIFEIVLRGVLEVSNLS